MRVKLRVDANECIAAANCVGVAPKFFDLGHEPVVQLLDRQGNTHGTEIELDVTAEELDLLNEAVDSCPTRAISVLEVK